MRTGDILLGVTLRWTGINSGRWGHLGSSATLPYLKMIHMGRHLRVQNGFLILFFKIFFQKYT